MNTKIADRYRCPICERLTKTEAGPCQECLTEYPALSESLKKDHNSSTRKEKK